MICKNCGAEYDGNLLVCPYCGSENEKRAREEQLEYIEDVKEKIVEVRNHSTVKAAKRASNIVVKITIAVVGVFLAVALGVWRYSVASSKIALKIQTKNLEKLETFYQTHRFEKMGMFLENEKLHGVTFYKYSDIADFYDRVEFILEEMDACMEKVQYHELRPDDVVWEIMDGMYQLHRIQEYGADGFVYGNEDAAMVIRQMYLDKMEEVFLLTEEEIDSRLPDYLNEKEANLEIASIAAERMNEVYR